MPRHVTFNGQTLFTPGGITRVTPNALTPIGISANGIIGLLGEADEGAPGSVGGIVTIDDPALAEETFGSGPLADAIRLAFDPSNDPRIPGGAFRVLCYKTNLSLQSSTRLPDTTALVAETALVGSTTTAINGSAGGVTLNQHAGRWLKIGSEKRRIVSNTASPNPVYTVSPAFSVAPAIAATFDILNDSMLLSSTGYGERQNQLSVEFEPGITANTYVVTLVLEDLVERSPELGGVGFLEMQYVGGAAAANGTGPITGATTSTVTLDPAAAPVLNAFAGMVLQFADGKQRLIASNTAADPTVITLAAGHELTTAEAAALVGTTATVRNVTSATATITGANGQATGMTSVVAPVADNLNITFPANQTLQQFVDYINANTNYRAAVPAGVNAQTTLMSSFDFGTRNTLVDVRFDQEILPATKGNFHRDLMTVIDWINDFATLATATRATTGTTEGAEVPGTTGGSQSVIQDVPVFFSGGARGTSSNSRWQDGFDEFLEVRVAQIAPLIAYDLSADGLGSTATFASVAAQLGEHVSQCAGDAKSERGGYIGGRLTKTQLINQAASLNSADVQLFGQKFTVLDSAGTLTQQPEWSGAVLAAGMRAGAPEIGEPLTFKLVRLTGLAQDATWSPNDKTDRNQLIEAGVMYAERKNKTGPIRWVRDITTHLLDDNDLYIDGNSRDAVRYVAYNLRTSLEDQFTGVKAKPANVANIRETTAALLQVYREASIIVESLDPETQTQVLPGWRNLRVFITGNVATIRVEIFPVTGIVFQLNDIFLQLPRLAA